MESCPVIPRVDALEEANRQHGATHREMFNRLNALERSTDSQGVMLRNIDEKLDEVKATVSGIYITAIKGARGGIEKPQPKKGFFKKLFHK